ncbi:MAG TPA: hypothetical protein VMW10_04880 [Alphaproteobacteria bacterium]|nr:hypothetical protein [Alphaproteobacteria bacterium]
MNKYLVFSFLIGFTPFSCFYSAQAMEEGPEKVSVSGIIPKQEQDPIVFSPPKYVVSPAEDAPQLSIAELRDQYPIHDMIHYGNLDSKLYASQTHGKDFRYNSFEEISDAVEKLKSIAHNSSGFRRPCEVNPLPHLFRAAISLVEGSHGLRQNRKYGAELMQWYLYETDFFIAHHSATILRKLSEENYSVENFLRDYRTVDKSKKGSSKRKFFNFYL